MRPHLPDRARVARPAHGLTLVELLVALVIGLVLIGVVLSNYLNSGAGRNTNAALSQMTEDASLGLNLLRKHISLAGYSAPYQFNTRSGLERVYQGQGIMGCDGGFTDRKVGTIEELTCVADPTNAMPDSIAIAYEADDQNSVRTDAGLPKDCVGNGIQQTAANGTRPAFFLANSRFFIGEGSLRCQGNGGGATAATKGVSLPADAKQQALVDNIVDLRVSYGISDTQSIDPTESGSPTSLPKRLPIKFVNASDVGTAWRNVVAVRVCVVVRSEQEILDAPAKYYGCDAVVSATPEPTLPNDRRLYRAFSTTVMVQNTMVPPP